MPGTWPAVAKVCYSAVVVRPLARRIGRRLASLPPWSILLAGWLYLIVYAFPGIMTQDSFDHLREARDRLYSDGHPPAINLLWKICDYIVAGPFLMLVIQSSCILAGLYLVMRRLFDPRPAAWIATAVFVFPPVMVPFAVIWKDPLMAGFLMLGFVALLSPRRGIRILGLVSMFCATSVRYNAIAATLPLVVLLFEWQPGLHWLKRYAIAAIAWVVVTLSAFQLNARLADHKLELWSSIAVFDIVGTLAFVDEDIPDPELEKLFEGTDLLVHTNIHGVARYLYTPKDFLPVTNHPTRTMWSLPINGYTPPPEPQLKAIARAWKQTLSSYPVAYAKHRISVMAEVVGLGEVRASGAIAKRDFRWPEQAHQMGLGTGWSRTQRALTRAYVFIVRHTPIFTVWMYIVVALLLLPLALRQRDVLALLLSGLGLETTLLLLAPSPDYRYSHWLVICTITSAIILGVRRYRASKSVRVASKHDRVG
ncbi:MAG: hypothetical protein JWP01_2295 [Myxococcales bacterium]|nr:hypothetical protein [Myxococcales bacterium]